MFFKKKKRKEKDISVKSEPYSEEELSELINESKKVIVSAEGEELIKHLNTLGELYYKLNKNDQAIKYYEESIKENKSLGKAYTGLMKLYNLKRQEGVNEKNNEKIQYYLDKIDELTKLSKDVMRGRI